MLQTGLINMLGRRRLRPRVVCDFDLALSGHETLANFDLASEHKAFVHARQHTGKSCVYLITALFNMVISWSVLK